ncbi:MAG: Rab family GTPase [Promethearchaeota archaeon]
MLVNEISIKLVVFGDASVGKTATINSFLYKNFPERYIPTIGSNISRKEYKLKDYLIRINIWDIGGQRSFNPLNPVFFNNVDVALLVFDLSKPKETLLELQNTYLKKLTEHSERCLTYLVGNKLDLISTEEDLKEISDRFSIKEIPLIFISAKTQDNVQGLFELLIYNFLQDWEKHTEFNTSHKISKDFLVSIKRSENELNDLFINLRTIDLNSLKKKSTASITKKVSISEKKENLLIEKLDKIKNIQYQVPNLNELKYNIITAYSNNLTAIKDIIIKLKNTPISLLNDVIDKTSTELNYFKEDFELKLQSILKLEDESKSKMQEKE